MLIAAMFAGHHTSSVTTPGPSSSRRNPICSTRVHEELEAKLRRRRRGRLRLAAQRADDRATVRRRCACTRPCHAGARAEKDFVYKDFFIEKGSWVINSPTVSHLMEEEFPNPKKFELDRYCPREEDKKVDFAYIRFAAVVTIAWARSFAVLQVKAILTILLRRFDFRWRTRTWARTSMARGRAGRAGAREVQAARRHSHPRCR